jgi:alpha-N-arabinofuranosidase
MIKNGLFPAFLASLILLFACHPEKEVRLIRIYPGSVISDVSIHPVGINLDFFMDGGRFPDAARSTTDAIKDMGVKYLRYPGGEKSDLYLFSKPPYDTSRPAVARSGGLEDYPGMITEDYSFKYDPLDFDEYIIMCRAAGAEPVVVVAADCYLIPLKEGEWVTSREQLIRHAAEWVRYANIKKGYGVKYWMIGNESWNPNNVNSTPGIYAQDVIDFSRAMKEVDPSILVIANGQGDKFFKTVITKAGDHIDRLTVSNYGVRDFHRGYSTYRDTAQVLIQPALTAIRAMNAYSTPDQMERFKMIVAEYGSIDWAGLWHGNNDMGHAIVTFDMAGQLLLQPQIEFSCFWNTRWIENETRPGVDHDALDMDGNLNPTGRALSIWGNFLGTRMIRAENSGKVLAYASLDPGSHTLYAYLVNKGDAPERVQLETVDHTITSILDAREFFGVSPEDIHPTWQQLKRIKPGKPVTLKGTSITLLKMRLEPRTGDGKGTPATYYFDPVAGNDSLHTGTTPGDPFKSLSMIGTIGLKPGDSLLLRSGATFPDRLYLSCKGNPGMPVVVGKYGGEAKPHVKVDGKFNDGVHLFNSEHVVIRDLEISNRGEIPVDGISGIRVELKDYGTAQDITLDNLFIHDVYGILVRENLGGGSAVQITNSDDDDTISRSSRFDGLIVQNCTIKDCQRNGIMMWGNWIRSKWYPSLHVVIRNNVLDGVPGDGIVPVACDGPLVEYNVMKNCPPTLPPSEPCDGIWPWSCDNAVVQFNVVSGHRSKVDGYAYDSDWNSTNSLFQYNLSFNNDGGFLLICNSGGWPMDWSIGNRGTRVRYNVSINDGLRDYQVEGHDSCFSPVIHITGPVYNTVIEKNLFYIPEKESPETDRTLCSLTDWRGYPDSTVFADNFIFAAEETRAVITGQSTRNICRDNHYTGKLQHPGEGFISHKGEFDSEMWYDTPDAGWNTLVDFLKDKKVLLKNGEITVLELLGYNIEEQ